MTNKRTCIVCGETVTGRSDKKYCSDYCRTSQHNKLNSDSTNLMRNVNNTLRKNRRILAELNPKGKMKVSREKLLEKGFKFTYFTNIYKTRSGNLYHFVYDQGYIELEDGMVALVIRQGYVE